MPSHNAVQGTNGVYKLQALDRAFAVLDLLSSSSAPMGLAEIAAALELHKSTAHRFLMVLERHRIVERTPAGKFRLGLRLCDFGSRAIEQYDLRDRANSISRHWSPRSRRPLTCASWRRRTWCTSTNRSRSEPSA
jgi:DNA-binding IclR family transcriptional regulator